MTFISACLSFSLKNVYNDTYIILKDKNKNQTTPTTKTYKREF